MRISKNEQKVIDLLKEEGIRFRREKTFPDLKSHYGEPLRFDFYIEEPRKILLEIDGEAHFQEAFGAGRRGLMKQQVYDEKKNAYCLAHDIPLYRIPYTDIDDLEYASDLIQEKYRVRSRYHNIYTL